MEISKNILLIGGSGFVSGALARMAIQEGFRVWAVTRGNRPVPEGVIHIKVDRNDRESFSKSIEDLHMKWDMVVDVFAMQADDIRQDLQVFGDRTKQLIFISTDFVYDSKKRSLFQKPDNHDDQSVYSMNGYGAKKREGELVLYQENTYPVNWTILRPGHIYGPGSLLGCLPTHGRDQELIEKLKAGKTLKLVGGGHFSSNRYM